MFPEDDSKPVRVVKLRGVFRAEPTDLAQAQSVRDGKVAICNKIKTINTKLSKNLINQKHELKKVNA